MSCLFFCLQTMCLPSSPGWRTSSISRRVFLTNSLIFHRILITSSDQGLDNPHNRPLRQLICGGHKGTALALELSIEVSWSWPSWTKQPRRYFCWNSTVKARQLCNYSSFVEIQQCGPDNLVITELFTLGSRSDFWRGPSGCTVMDHAVSGGYEVTVLA